MEGVDLGVQGQLTEEEGIEKFDFLSNLLEGKTQERQRYRA